MKRLPLPLLGFAVFLAVFPFFLRRRPRVERRITILAAPETIFPFLNDLRNWPLWTAWSRRENIHYTYGSTAIGPGAEQRWESGRMSGAMRIIKSEPDTRLDYELDLRDGAQRIFGRMELHRDGACTRVVWRCVWDLAAQPYHRYCDLFLRWMMRRDFAEGLENLKDVVERVDTHGLADA